MGAPCPHGQGRALVNRAPLSRVSALRASIPGASALLVLLPRYESLISRQGFATLTTKLSRQHFTMPTISAHP
jgi:hypothetical protein